MNEWEHFRIPASSVLIVAPKPQNWSLSRSTSSSMDMNMNPLKETMMFGRVRRASPSSLDSFDTPPSKIFKDDPLSIYEATLIKLKQGSQRDLSPLPMEAVEMESESETETVQSTFCSSANACESSNHLVSSSNEEDMVIDTDTSCSTSILSTPSVSQSTYESKQERSKNASLLYLFSKYNSTRHASNSSQGASNGSAASSPSCSSCLSVG